MTDLVLDCETRGGFAQHHPDFRVLFNGWLWNGRMTQTPRSLFDYADPLTPWDEHVLVGANLKYDEKCLLSQGQTVPPSIRRYDVQVAAHCIHEELDSYHLEDLGKLFGYPHPNYKNLIDFDHTDYWDDPDLPLYNRHDLLNTQWIKDRTWPILQKQGKDKLFGLMMDYLGVMARVEWEGVQVDEEILAQQEVVWEAKRNSILEDLKAQGLELCDDPQGYSSKVLLEYFKAKGIKLPLTPKGNESAAESAMLQIEHPTATSILQLRECNKQLNTYIRGFRSTLVDGRYYPDYRLTATVTQRLGEHFVQVMPRAGTSEFKRCIISKHPGGMLIAADWSQLELRIIAETIAAMTGDTRLADDLNGGLDIHDGTLKRFPQLPDRTRAKNVNFSVFYMGSGGTLVKQYGLNKAEAEAIKYDLLVGRYPAAKAWHNASEIAAIRDGKVRAITGFERHTNRPTEAVNAPIQHLGTTFNKILMMLCYNRLIREGYAARPIADVHDEIILDVPRKEVSEIPQLIRDEAARLPEVFHQYFGYTLKMRYDVELKQGHNLFTMEKLL